MQQGAFILPAPLARIPPRALYPLPRPHSLLHTPREQGLDESKGDLSKALPAFEARRAPEAKALAELMTFSYPWQVSRELPLYRHIA